MAHHLLGSAAAREGGDALKQFCLAHQMFLTGIDLHGVTKGTARTRYDGDLLDRRCAGLHGGDHRVSNLMVTDNTFLLG